MRPARRRAWLLNLDAEDELSGRSVPAARVAHFAAQLTLPPGDLRLGEELASPAEVHPCCWSPTPRARRTLDALGVRLPDAPPVAVLRRVLHRGFALEGGATLPGQAFFEGTFDTLAAALRDAPPGGWRLKPARSYAGRGQRTVPGSRSWTAADRAFAESALAGEGLLAEPELDLLHEAATHGFVRRDGCIELLPPVGQRVDRGTWRASAPLASAFLPHASALAAAARVAGARLAAAGYWGPFGVDAYLYRSEGEVRLNPVGEVNARWTMSSVPRAAQLKT